MPTINLFHREAVKLKGTKFIKAPLLDSFDVTLDVPDEFANEYKADPALREKVENHIKSYYNDYVQEVEGFLLVRNGNIVDGMIPDHVERLKLAGDDKAKQAASAKALEKGIQEIQGIIEDSEKFAREKAVKAIAASYDAPLKQLKAKYKEWKKYQVSTVVGCTLKVAAAGVNIAVLVAGSVGTFGASTVPSIISTSASVIAAYNELSSAFTSADKNLKALMKDIKKLQEKYQDLDPKKAQKKTEWSELKNMLKDKVFMPHKATIKDCREKCKTVHAQFAGITVKGHKLAKGIQTILEELPNLDKELAEINKKLAKDNAMLKREDKLQSKLDKRIKKLNEILIDATDKFEKVEAAEHQLDEIHKALTMMADAGAQTSEQWSAAVKALSIAIDVAFMVTSPQDFLMNVTFVAADLAVDAAMS
jgi:DNA repair exonuclease SbcCD ATPase subunit